MSAARASSAARMEQPASRAFAPIRQHRTFETIIERIVDAIDAGGLRSGDRLPNEMEMCRRLEVSRPTLRQALRVLETSGVIGIKAGQSGGIFVATDMVPADLLGRNIARETHHVGELIATRRLIEPVVYHLAAENASAGELDRIAETVTLMERHAGTPAMVMRADGMFHRRIAHASGNQILIRLMTGIYRDLAPLWSALRFGQDEVPHMVDVHSRQLAAIRARDHVALDAVLRETFVDLEAEFGINRTLSLSWTGGDPRGPHVVATAPTAPRPNKEEPR